MTAGTRPVRTKRCVHRQQGDKIDDNDNGTDSLDTYLRGGPFGISRYRRRNKLHLPTR